MYINGKGIQKEELRVEDTAGTTIYNPKFLVKVT
jgi:hypothetical protein